MENFLIIIDCQSQPDKLRRLARDLNAYLQMTLGSFIWRRVNLLGSLVIRGLNFSSLLRGNFLAFLAELDLARMRNRRPRPFQCTY